MTVTAIVVPWTFGNIKNLIEGQVWEGFNPRQKALWLREMNSDSNLLTNVRLEQEPELVELYFHRRIPGQSGAASDATYLAGKWVKLENFQEVMQEAIRFRQ